MTGPIRQRVELRCPDERAVSRRGTVLSLRGELDSCYACVLQARVSDIRGQARARCVADLADLAFSDPVCLGVLVRHRWQIPGRGGSFALAGSRGAGRRVLSVTGLLSSFEVRDTVEEARVGAPARRSAGPEADDPGMDGAGRRLSGTDAGELTR